MIVIDSSSPVHREVQLLAAAWALGPVDAVGRLLDFYYAHTTEPTSSVDEVDVAVHAIYRGVRVEGRYNRGTHVLTVTSEPLAGKSFTSPSTARTAVVTTLNPSSTGHGSGWQFWRITATGDRLETIRRRT